MIHRRQLGTLFGLALLCVALSVMSPYFLTISNLLNVAQQTSINAIIAAGMTFVIISAGIDLSVGSIVAFSGVVMASALEGGAPVILAILAGLATGAAGVSAGAAAVRCGLVGLVRLVRLLRGALGREDPDHRVGDEGGETDDQDDVADEEQKTEDLFQSRRNIGRAHV